MSTVQNQEKLDGSLLQERRCTPLWPQVLVVVIAWLYVCWLHWANDGLWYGDAPRHAANGLFWKDYLLNLSFDPRDYALSYHARYPVIAPTSYPPAFYLLEAAAFGVFGPSPYVAKGLVLLFALMTGLYTTAWCRRWITQDAGWAGALFVLLPSVVQWSHAIMLNVPALALSIGALYHLRRWLEYRPGAVLWRHLYIAAAMAVAAIMTYLTSYVILLLGVIWIIVERRWRLLWNRRTLATIVASALALLPWAIVVLKYESNRLQQATRVGTEIFDASEWHWEYYLKLLPDLFGAHILIIAAVGVAFGMLSRRWRHETSLLLIMAATCYVFFCWVPAREGRYILLMALPIACFCMICLQAVVGRLGQLATATAKWPRAVSLAIVSALFIGQGWVTSKTHVMSVSGYKEVVAFLEKVAPNDPVFYDGKHHAMFTHRVQAGDPDYHRRVVLGRKLLYVEAFYSQAEELVSSPQDVVEVLQKRGGCRWIVVADQPDARGIKAPGLLREALRGPEFELVRSFPIRRVRRTDEQTMGVQVYRFLVPVDPVDDVEMPLYALGKNVRTRIKPIER